MDAHCCRALSVHHAETLEKARDFVRELFLAAMKGDPECVGSLRFFANLEPLPEQWRHWSQESKACCPQAAYKAEPVQHWRCKLLKDGRCSIHPRRPPTCSDFKPKKAWCQGCDCFREGGCTPETKSEAC